MGSRGTGQRRYQYLRRAWVPGMNLNLMLLLKGEHLVKSKQQPGLCTGLGCISHNHPLHRPFLRLGLPAWVEKPCSSLLGSRQSSHPSESASWEEHMEISLGPSAVPPTFGPSLIWG